MKESKTPKMINVVVFNPFAATLLKLKDSLSAAKTEVQLTGVKLQEYMSLVHRLL